MRDDFLTSTKWRPKTDSNGNATGNGNSTVNPGEMLSNGDPANPQGKLFAYPTVVIFARDITISRSVYEQMEKVANRESGGSGGFSIGPFGGGASASHNKTEKTLQIERKADSVTVKGMQIIGFRNRILPMCPNPDKKIKNWI
jgi:hypothetical protein